MEDSSATVVPSAGTPAAPLLEIRDLKLYYPGPDGPVRAVDGVSLAVFRGETLALVGESGSGKSTLARAAVGLEAPTEGSVQFAGAPVLPFPHPSRRALAKRMQMVFQDPDASLNPRRDVLATLREPLDLHQRLTAAARDERVRDLLVEVGLDPALRRRYPHELSGGQKQRVCIARALAVEPELLVCDEAVSALDVSIQAQILNLLVELREKRGLSYLFITHDLRVVRQIADRIAVMSRGKLVEVASADQLFAAPADPYTRLLLAAVPVPEAHSSAGAQASSPASQSTDSIASST
jgi:ABC-type glutathione transport system ATPase component